jgi:glyoxylase-like metal-dependent hydrolase (beta-lactamase superfamily II)
LATVTQVPEAHPEFAVFEPFPVHAWVIRHPDGIVLFDTGIGLGHPDIDEWYHPESTTVADALAAVEVDVADVAAIVLSHLHFDHCGQVQSFDAPVYVQADEVSVSAEPGYTVPEWADIAPARLRQVHGDDEILDGLRLLSTPGHTPGHQSIVLDAAGEQVVLAAQCAYRADELRSGQPSAANARDPSWLAAAEASLARVRQLAPCSVHFSHDATVLDLSVP